MKEFLKIVSGGQTGVDRGALKAAKAPGIQKDVCIFLKSVLQ